MEDLKHKKCHHCHETKSIVDFNKCKTGMFGYHNHCRDCQKKIKRHWYLNNRAKALEYAKTHAKEFDKERYQNDSQWREKLLEQNRIRRRKESAKIQARIQRSKWYSIPQNRIAQNLRSRIRVALEKGYKIQSCEKLLGCSFETAKQYLESQFQSGMSWDNYGDWHIDHIIPCDFFDLTKNENQLLCFNYRNLRPMWAKENIAKNNKITIDDICGFLENLKKSVLVHPQLVCEPKLIVQ